MFSKGWVKASRSEIDLPIFQNVHIFWIWSFLTRKATRKPHIFKYQGVDINLEVGQILIPYKWLEKKLKINRTTILRHIHKLEKEGFLVHKILKNSAHRSAQGFAHTSTVVTICNYKEILNIENDSAQGFAHTSAQHKQDCIKQDFKETNKIHAQVSHLRECVNMDFEKIYEEYPRKRGKGEGLKLCRKKIKTSEQYYNLLKAVRNYKNEKKDCPMEFIKQFDSFMHVWEDWVEPESEIKESAWEKTKREFLAKGE